MIINNPGPFPAQGRHLHPCSHKFKSHILFSTLSKKKTAIQTNSLRILAPFHACVVNWSSIMTIERHIVIWTFGHWLFVCWKMIFPVLRTPSILYFEVTLYNLIFCHNEGCLQFWSHSVSGHYHKTNFHHKQRHDRSKQKCNILSYRHPIFHRWILTTLRVYHH